MDDIDFTALFTIFKTGCNSGWRQMTAYTANIIRYRIIRGCRYVDRFQAYVFKNPAAIVINKGA
jgi:hypothetical protein